MKFKFITRGLPRVLGRADSFRVDDRTLQGFSFLELLIVLVITAILAAFTVPVMSSFLRNSEIDAAKLELLRAIYLTRSEANQLGKPVQFSKNLENLNYEIHSTDGVLFTLQNLQGLHWRAALGYDYLEFIPFGKPRSDGSFWYCYKKDSYPAWEVTLNQFGRTRIVLPNANNEIFDSEGKRLIC